MGGGVAKPACCLCEYQAGVCCSTPSTSGPLRSLLVFNGVHTVPSSFLGPFVCSWRASAVNTASRQLEDFNGEGGSLCLGSGLGVHGTGDAGKVGALGSGFLVNVPLFMGQAG